MTVCPAASTEEAFQRRLEQEEAKGEPALDPVEYAREYRSDEASDHRKFLRWTSSEWEYEGFNVPESQELDAILNEVDLWDVYSREGIARPQKFLTRLMTEVLADLDREGVFGTGAPREKVVLFVTITDSDASIFVENRSAKKLNPRSSLSEFLDRLPR